MTQIATTIEQSKRLIEAGLDPKSADMFWGYLDFGGVLQIDLLPANPHIDVNSTISPAWSLSRLIDIHGDFNYGPMNNGSEAVLDCIVDSIIYNIEYKSGRIKEEYLAK